MVGPDSGEDEAPVIRWGVAGPGRIAGRFAAAMTRCAGGTIHAVASRDRRRALAYADEHGVPVALGSYDELLHRPDVDVVYVAVPHAFHAEVTVAALDAGKHVLCEKPLAMNASQVQAMVDAARSNGRFLMEALWSRFLPAYQRIGEELAAGRIGRPVLVEGTFGFRAAFDPAHRFFDPALGGGALLDLGIYPLHLAAFSLGPIESVHAVGVLGDTGVDEVTTVLTGHPGGAAGVSMASYRADLGRTGVIHGEAGRIELAPPLHDPPELTITDGAGTEVVSTTYDGDGLQFEIRQVHRCLAAGVIESAVMPWSDSLALAAAMDEVLRHLGVSHPST
jgi:predicted dehydrogenase